jgi:PAS domain S-box-containing protein
MAETVHSATRILYADDTEAQRYALSRVLQRAGFEVIEAGTGRQALERMESHPDLVVLDVNLPDISGFEVCREIKKREASARIPVLHVSATVVTTDARVTALEGGADAYLVQPIAPEELIATIRALLRVRKADQALWRSNEQYRLFFEATPLPCLVFDTSDLTILAVNAAAVAKYGYSREEFAQMNLRNIVSEDDLPNLKQNLNVPPTANLVRRHRTKDGAVLDVEVTWAPLSLEHRDARLAIIQDITEKLKREAAEKEETMRRLLLEHVLQAQEEERQRISRELHDETGQLMTSLLIGLRSLSDARRLADARQHAQHLREIASRAIGELSRLARGLHSSMLDDLGLEAALRRYTDEFSSTHCIDVKLDLTANLSALRRSQQLNLYRIIQEALTNVARHAHASEVCINLANAGKTLRVSIRDNGVGFAPLSDSTGMAGHLGIAGMKQRAAMLGGALGITSQPQQGVTLELSIPLEGKEPAESVA